MSGLPSPLSDAARAYVDALPAGRYVAFSLTPLDRTGVAVWKVALFLDEAKAGQMPSGYGYGATYDEAILGALGEIAEIVYPTAHLTREAPRLGTYDDLVREVGARGIADPLTLCLPAGSPVGRTSRLAWVRATRAASGEPVLVPLDLVALEPFELPAGYRPFTTLITNGLGAGPDLDWAVGHGLLELLQRDGNGLVFRALDQGVLLSLDRTPLEAPTRDLLDRLDALGIEVLPKFATDEFGLANLYVVGFDREGHGPRVPIMLSACGEACDPSRDRALRKALLEFCSARVRKTYAHGPMAEAMRVAPPDYVDRFIAQAMPSLESEESRALRAMMDWATREPDELRAFLKGSVYSVKEHCAFDTLPSTPLPDARARGRLARERLEAAGLDVLYVDFSPPDRSIASVKVIVPGLEVETMSYYRIGERNARKLLERDSPLIRFGTADERRRPIRLTPEALDRFGAQPLFDTEAVDRVVGPLYPLYREPEAHHVAYRMAGRAHA